MHSYEWEPAFGEEWTRPLALFQPTEIQVGVLVSLPKVVSQVVLLQVNMLPSSRSLPSAALSSNEWHLRGLVLVTMGAWALGSLYLFVHLTMYMFWCRYHCMAYQWVYIGSCYACVCWYVGIYRNGMYMLFLWLLLTFRTHWEKMKVFTAKLNMAKCISISCVCKQRQWQHLLCLCTV